MLGVLHRSPTCEVSLMDSHLFRARWSLWPGDNDDVVLCEIAQCIGGECAATVIADHIRNITEDTWGILRVIPLTAPFQQAGFKIKPDSNPWLCKWRESCDGCKKMKAQVYGGAIKDSYR